MISPSSDHENDGPTLIAETQSAETDHVLELAMQADWGLHASTDAAADGDR